MSLRRGPLSLSSIAWIGSAVLGLLVLAPVVVILSGSLHASCAHGSNICAGAWSTAWGKPGVARAIENTITLAIVEQLVALPIAVAIAVLLGRTDIPAARWLELGFWISFFLPTLAVLQGWVLLADPHYGLINQAFGIRGTGGEGPVNIYSWWGIVFAHMVTGGISAKVMFLTPIFRTIDSQLEEAASLTGDGPLRTLWRITLPLARPAIIVAGLFGFIKSMESFEIELLIGIPRNIIVYSTLIYDIVGADPPDFATANVLGSVIIVVLALVSAACSGLFRSGGGATAAHMGGPKIAGRKAAIALGGWRWPSFLLCLLVVALMTIVPLGLLVAASFMELFGFLNLPHPWTLAHWHDLWVDRTFLLSLCNTLILGIAAALGAILVAVPVAYLILRAPRLCARILDFLSWLPATMPGILFSLAAFSIILSSDTLSSVYGAVASLVVVTVISGLSGSVQIVKNGLGQIGLGLEEAAWISGVSRWRGVIDVTMPLASQTIVVVALMSFIGAIRSIGSLALLVTSTNRPLALLQLEYMNQGHYEQSAVVGVLTTIFAILAALAMLRINGGNADLTIASPQARPDARTKSLSLGGADA